MSRTVDEPSTRRQWGVAAARAMALGGIAWITGSLLTRRAAAQGCFREVPACGDCTALAACRLPEAIHERQRGGRQNA